MVCRDWDAGNVIADVLHTGKGIAGNPVVSNGQVDPAADGQQSHAPTGPRKWLRLFCDWERFRDCDGHFSHVNYTLSG
jgi:hypothetical protein